MNPAWFLGQVNVFGEMAGDASAVGSSIVFMKGSPECGDEKNRQTKEHSKAER